MNVLLVTPWSPTAIGGVSTAITSIGREFAALGHAVTILKAGASDAAEPESDVEGIPVYGMYLRAPFRERLLRSVGGTVARLRRTLRLLDAFLRERSIDVVAVQYPLPWMFYFGVLRRRAQWKLVVTYQGNDAHDLAGWSRVDRRLVGLLLSRADCVTGVSGTLLDKVRRVVKLPESRSIVIPNGAPVDRLASAAALPAGLPPFHALGVGLLIRRKGFDTVISAVGIAARRGIRIPLVIAGDGPERGALQDLAVQEGVAELVHFAGEKKPDDVLGHFRQCSFFVLGSREEGMPLVIAEAMAAGRAVVATDVGGVGEIVEDGRTGLIVAVDQPDAMAEAMMRLAEDGELRESMGAAGRARALEHFNWTAVSRRYLGLFEDIISRSAA